MPDILLLPELATYFDVSVDELLGYEPQLSKEQIQKLYIELSECFASMPFEEAFTKSEVLVKKYYSCYRFLLQMGVLWLNHYMMAGDREKADSFTQASMYLHMVVLLGDAVNYFSMHMQEKEICEETISRLDKLIDAFKLDGLNLNVAAIYQYQAAVYYAIMGENEKAIKRLERYAKTVTDLLHCGRLHGDSYFTKLNHWFEQLDLGSQMPRSKKLILENARENLKNPIFAGLKQMKDSLAIERILEEI